MAAIYELIYYGGVPGRGEHIRLALEEPGPRAQTLQASLSIEAEKSSRLTCEPRSIVL